MQASYRLWHTRCVPQCARACEQVARSWADASLQDIAMGGTLSAATRTVPNSKRAITSPTNGGAAQILYSKTGPREIQKAGSKRRCRRARDAESFLASSMRPRSKRAGG